VPAHAQVQFRPADAMDGATQREELNRHTDSLS
jgi:hypothetical protein